MSGRYYEEFCWEKLRDVTPFDTDQAAFPAEGGPPDGVGDSPEEGAEEGDSPDLGDSPEADAEEPGPTDMGAAEDPDETEEAEEDAPPEVGKANADGEPVDFGTFLHISPSQNEMFLHLGNAEKEGKKAFGACILALLPLAGIVTGSAAMFGFLAAGAFFLLFAVQRMKASKAAEEFVSDPKRGYLRIESGMLHCEQGVGVEYEELHIPIRKVKETLAFGNARERLLALSYEPGDAVMLVNGKPVDEDVYELRGGVYEQPDWNMFTRALNDELPAHAKFDRHAWDDARKKKPVFLIAGLSLLGLSAAFRMVLLLTPGLIVF